MAIVHIGVMYDIKHINDEVVATAKDGWHVDSLVEILDAEDFLINVETPNHMFLGVEDSTVFKYKFDSKEHANLYISLLDPERNNG